MGRKRGLVDRARGPRGVTTSQLVLENVINLEDRGPI